MAYKFIPYDSDIVFLLHQAIHDVCPLVARQFGMLFSIALNHNGFIAGGFSRLAYKLFVLNKEYDRNFIKNEVSNYLRLDCSIAGSNKLKDRGDVDIWFPTEDLLTNYKLFVENIPSREINKRQKNDPIGYAYLQKKPSTAGYATEYVLSDRVIFQVIEHCSPMKQILDSFDIVNVKIAMTQDGFYVDDRVDSLEQRKVIDVDHFLSLHSIYRVYNYVKKNKFSLDPLASERLVEFAFSEKEKKSMNDIMLIPNQAKKNMNVSLYQQISNHRIPVDGLRVAEDMFRTVFKMKENLSNEALLLMIALGIEERHRSLGYPRLMDFLKERTLYEQ